MDKPVQLFLSYTRKDEAAVTQLYERLAAVGLKPWMDHEDILPGELWQESILQAIRDSHFFLVCISPTSVEKRGGLQRELRETLDAHCDEWESWLAEQRAEHGRLTAKIVRLETELNARVYELFDLTPAEIKIIEESTKYRYGEA